jgi:hypothetical protein
MNTSGIASETYRVAATCSNCGNKGSVTKKKGEEMPDKSSCPNCGCYAFVVQKYFGVSE